MSDTILSLPTTTDVLEHEWDCDDIACECLLTDEQLTNNWLQACYEVEVGLWD
tara:strand:- start:404 stop:562 length:159 start_codon:yes stop_codon:yes gene_type:complete